MALYVTRPRRDEERIGRGLPIATRRPIFSRTLSESSEKLRLKLFHKHTTTSFKNCSSFKLDQLIIINKLGLFLRDNDLVV